MDHLNRHGHILRKHGLFRMPDARSSCRTWAKSDTGCKLHPQELLLAQLFTHVSSSRALRTPEAEALLQANNLGIPILCERSVTKELGHELAIIARRLGFQLHGIAALSIRFVLASGTRKWTSMMASCLIAMATTPSPHLLSVNKLGQPRLTVCHG
jgi:hypothetical protein